MREEGVGSVSYPTNPPPGEKQEGIYSGELSKVAAMNNNEKLISPAAAKCKKTRPNAPPASTWTRG